MSIDARPIPATSVVRDEGQDLLSAYLDVLVEHRDLIIWIDGDKAVLKHPTFGERLTDTNRRVREAFRGDNRSSAAASGHPIRTSGVALGTWNYPGRMFRRATLCRAVVAILLAGTPLAGCGDDDGSRDSRVADAYIVVVEWVLAEPSFAPDPTLDEMTPVFVDGLGPGEIDLGVQVEIVRHFEPVVDIRFIDTRAEAVDESEVGAPVREGGLLLGLGPVPVEGPIDIRGEVYQTLDRVVGYRFRVARSGQTMVLMEPPLRVEPENLVGEL